MLSKANYSSKQAPSPETNCAKKQLVRGPGLVTLVSSRVASSRKIKNGFLASKFNDLEAKVRKLVVANYLDFSSNFRVRLS